MLLESRTRLRARGIILLLQEDFELERVKREKQKCVEWVVGVGRVINGEIFKQIYYFFILPSDRSRDFIYLFNYFIGMCIALCTRGR